MKRPEKDSENYVTELEKYAEYLEGVIRRALEDAVIVVTLVGEITEDPLDNLTN